MEKVTLESLPPNLVVDDVNKTVDFYAIQLVNTYCGNVQPTNMQLRTVERGL